MIIELPNGYVTEEGEVLKEVEIKELTGADEEYLGSIKDRNKLMTALLSRLVVSVGGRKLSKEQLKKLCIGDIEYILVKAREMSYGDEIEVRYQCPSCNVFNTDVILISSFNLRENSEGVNKINIKLKRGLKNSAGEFCDEVVVRFPNGEDQEIIAPYINTNPAKATSLLLERIILEMKGFSTFGKADILNMTKVDRDYIISQIMSHMGGYDLKRTVECKHCGAVFEQTMELTNFFSLNF